MPRDANGNYTLPAGNPVVSGTTIDTTWANPTMQDIGNELTDSLSRNGEGGMLVPFKFADGAIATPAMTWTNEETTGIYRAGTNDMRVSVGAVDKFRWTASSVEIWNSVDLIWETVATTNAVTGFLPLTGGTLEAPAGGLTLGLQRPLDTQSLYIAFKDTSAENKLYLGLNTGLDSGALLNSYDGDLDIQTSTAINLNAPLVTASVLNASGQLGFSSTNGSLKFNTGNTNTGYQIVQSGSQLIIKRLLNGAPDGDIINLSESLDTVLIGGKMTITDSAETLTIKAANTDDAIHINFKSSANTNRGYVGFPTFATALMEINSFASDLQLTSTSEINLNAPIVNVNGTPIALTVPKAGQVVALTGVSNAPVVFTTPYPNANYSISATAFTDPAGTAAAGYKDKTANGFTLVNNDAATLTIDWIATPFNS